MPFEEVCFERGGSVIWRGGGREFLGFADCIEIAKLAPKLHVIGPSRNATAYRKRRSGLAD